MKRTLIVGLTLFVSAALTTGAMAANDKFGKTTDVPAALTGLGVNATSATKAQRNRQGRVDMVYKSSANLQSIVAKAAKAYSTGKVLPGNFQVVGYAKLDRRGSYSLTLDRNGYYSVVEIWPQAGGTKIAYRTKSRFIKRKSPRVPRTPVVPRVNR